MHICAKVEKDRYIQNVRHTRYQVGKCQSHKSVTFYLKAKPSDVIPTLMRTRVQYDREINWNRGI